VTDMIEEIIATLETAYAQQNWELVLETIHLLNEIPPSTLPNEEDDEEGFDF